MGKEKQGRRKSTHVRVYEDKKKRLQTIAFTRSLREDAAVKEIGVLDEILERELPKIERRLI